MFARPWDTQEFLEKIILKDGAKDIYGSLKSDDVSETVMTIFEKIRYCPHTKLIESKKSASASDEFREQGNMAFKLRCHREAQIAYNKAIAFAPANSRQLIQAYNNRSALLFHINERKHAFNDIQICYQLSCPNDLMRKLKAREKEIQESGALEKFGVHMLDLAPKHLLELKSVHSDLITYASKAVTLDMSGPRPTVVAAEPISTGTVVSSEEAYTNVVNESDTSYTLCYYCTRPSFNLIPCENCSIAMFCDEDCRKKCLEEYHAIECKIISDSIGADWRLALKTVIKIRNQFNSWDEYIETSKNFVTDNSVAIDPRELFVESCPFSGIYSNKNISVNYGKRFSSSHASAMMIKQLMDVGYFPPSSDMRLAAMKTMARQMMYILLYTQKTVVHQVAEPVVCDSLGYFYMTFGVYRFLGKLKHSCDPNLIVVAMNNRVVLLAIRAIPRGTPLTISYVNHYNTCKVIDHCYQNRMMGIYKIIGEVCSCVVCEENWGETPKKIKKLSKEQKQYLKESNWETNIGIMGLTGTSVKFYERLCKGLDLFSANPNTVEQQNMFVSFIKSVGYLQNSHTRNKVIVDQFDWRRLVSDD